MPFQPKIASINKKKQQITEVKTSGSVFTVPAGVTKMLVTAIGGGGGGGFAFVSRTASFSAEQVRVTAASGAGGSSESRYFAVTPGQTIFYQIGNGGVGGTAPATLGSGGVGGTGGNSSCTVAGVIIGGRGGGGGGSVQHRDSPALDVIGVGGLSNGVTLGISNVAPEWALKGGVGVDAQRVVGTNQSALTGGNGGGGAGTLSVGVSAHLGGSLYGGNGGQGVSTGTLNGLGGSGNDGLPGSSFGGGGSGGAANVYALLSTRSVSKNGGSGAAGAVIITYWKR